MTDQIEQEIRAKGLNAPRVTPEDIEAAIAGEHYFSAQSGIEGAISRGELCGREAVQLDVENPMPYITICVIVLRNGHKIVGVNTGAVSNANFDPELARKLARKNAVDQIWPLLGYALRERLAMTAAARDVLAERRRQIDEGWVPEHDDEHDAGELAAAAACYAGNAAGYVWNGEWLSEVWPWEREWWKPTTPRRDLVKAAALILAEIERLDRAADDHQHP